MHRMIERMFRTFMIVAIVGWFAVDVVQLHATSSSSDTTWQQSIRLPGAMVPRHGVLVTIPSKWDQQQSILSWNVRLGRPDLVNRPMVYWPGPQDHSKAAMQGKWLNVQTMRISLPKSLSGITRQATQLTVRYVNVGKQRVVIDATPFAEIRQFPASGLVLAAVNQTIYQLDMVRKTANAFLSSNVAGYKQKQLESLKEEETILVWGANPMINRTGTMTAYFTNRQGLKVPRGQVIGQIWLKNHKTKQEKAFYNGTYEMLGWDRQNRLYVLDRQQVVRIDTNHQKKTVIRSHVPLCVRMGTSHLFVPDGSGHLIIQPIGDDHEKVRKIPLPQAVRLQAIEPVESQMVDSSSTTGLSQGVIAFGIGTAERPRDRLLYWTGKDNHTCQWKVPDGMLIRSVAALDSQRTVVILRQLENGQEMTDLLSLRLCDSLTSGGEQ